jgi:precorrin-4 methylase
MRKSDRWLDRTLLRSPIYYCLCLNEKDFKYELKRLGVEDEVVPFLSTTHAGATAHHFDKTTAEKPTYAVIITMGNTKGRTREQIYGLLVHEAMHIWRAVRELLGETSPASEQEAYAMQEIAQSLMESYRDQTKKKR